MKKKEIIDKGFFGWKFNKFLTKASNLMLVIGLIVYVAVFVIAITCIKSKKVDSILIPEYEHVFYSEEVTNHFAIIPQRTYSSDGTETLNYRVIFYNQGRYINGTDPGYRISSFVAKAGIVSSVENKDIEELYYFTEYTDGQTSSSHNLTLNSNSGTVNPISMYSRIRYRAGTVDKVVTFKEDIMLMPTSEDITRLNNMYDTKIKPINDEYDKLDSTSDEAIALKKTGYILNIDNADLERIGIVQFIASYDSDTTKYSVTLRMEMVDKTVKYHNDCQTWIETTDGKYLPYMGVYGFTSDHDKYNSGSYNLYDATNCKYLCIKVVSYDDEGNYTTSYYKQEISRIETATYNYSISNSGLDCTYINE